MMAFARGHRMSASIMKRETREEYHDADCLTRKPQFGGARSAAEKKLAFDLGNRSSCLPLSSLKYICPQGMLVYSVLLFDNIHHLIYFRMDCLPVPLRARRSHQ